MKAGAIKQSRKLGKYAGTCAECGLMRGTEDDPTCGRCGHKYETEAVPRDLNGNIKPEVEE